MAKRNISQVGTELESLNHKKMVKHERIPVKSPKNMQLNVMPADVLWDYKDINEWSADRNQMLSLNMNDVKYLTKFAKFYA